MCRRVCGHTCSFQPPTAISSSVSLVTLTKAPSTASCSLTERPLIDVNSVTYHGVQYSHYSTHLGATRGAIPLGDVDVNALATELDTATFLPAGRGAITALSRRADEIARRPLRAAAVHLARRHLETATNEHRGATVTHRDSSSSRSAR